jgi:SAM-dependent methyltransferase
MMDAKQPREELWPAPDRREMWARLMALLDPRPGETILDLGFGGGQALRYIADQVGAIGRALGIEALAPYADQMRAIKRQRGLQQLDVLVAKGQSLPFPADSLDAVLCVNVLEAIPERLAAVREMKRVLRPGGRLLLVHGDYESMAYTSTDRELGRRAVLAYASAKFASYEAGDGQMGRHLRGLVKHAGFSWSELRVFPWINTEYREPLLGWTLAQFSADFVAPVSDLTDPELDQWRADLAARSALGEYLFCLNLYCCLAHK